MSDADASPNHFFFANVQRLLILLLFLLLLSVCLLDSFMY